MSVGLCLYVCAPGRIPKWAWGHKDMSYGYTQPKETLSLHQILHVFLVSSHCWACVLYPHDMYACLCVGEQPVSAAMPRPVYV